MIYNKPSITKTSSSCSLLCVPIPTAYPFYALINYIWQVFKKPLKVSEEIRMFHPRCWKPHIPVWKCAIITSVKTPSPTKFAYLIFYSPLPPEFLTLWHIN